MKDITKDDVRKAALDLVRKVDKYEDDEDEGKLTCAYIDGICILSEVLIAEIDKREAEAERELEEWRRKQAEKAAATEA